MFVNNLVLDLHKSYNSFYLDSREVFVNEAIIDQYSIQIV